MSDIESHPDVEELIEECEEYGADIDRDRVRSDYHLRANEYNIDHDETLWMLEHEITERHNLPKNIKFGPVESRGTQDDNQPTQVSNQVPDEILQSPPAAVPTPENAKVE